MSDTIVPAATYAERDFQVGAALSKAFTVLARNALPFGIIAVTAVLPLFLLRLMFLGQQIGVTVNNPSRLLWTALASLAMSIVLGAISQAIILYGAFEDMRGRPVNLISSIRFGGRRILSVLGVAVLFTLLTGLATLLLVIPGLIVFTMWYVAIPACVVEGTGPRKSLSRSAELTKGHRWKVFGMLTVFIIIDLLGNQLLVVAAAKALGATVGLLTSLVWRACLGAFYPVLAVVTYHDLRVAKEGVDTDQIAAVFE
jgi:hypothetical protein